MASVLSLRPDKFIVDKLKKRSTTKLYKNRSTYFEGDDPVTQLPKLFITCVNFIEEHGLDSEGILRCSGRVIESKAISALLENKGTNLGQVDVNAVASTLKAYISDGPQSLLPADRYILFIKLAEDDNPENITLLRELIANMPLSNQRVLHRLMLFLHKVIEHGENNKMNARSIAIIFGPILLRTFDKQSVSQQLSDNSSLIKLAEKIINNTEFLFNGIGLAQSYTPSSKSHGLIPREVSEMLAPKEVLRDRVKIRFILLFSLNCDPPLQGTQALFVKWSRGITQGGGTTNHILCTNPAHLSWDEAVAFETTVMYVKKTKQFETKNMSIALKEVTERGTKTLGSAWVNLSEFLESDITTNLSPAKSTSYDLTSKYQKKGLRITVECQYECLKVNSKILLKSANSNGTGTGTSHSITESVDDEDSFISSEESFETGDGEEEIEFDPNSEESSSFVERPIHRVPSSNMKRPKPAPSNHHRLVPRDQYSTLPLPRGGKVANIPHDVSSTSLAESVALGTRPNDVLDKMSHMLFEKDKQIDQLKKQIGQLSRQIAAPTPNTSDSEVHSLRIDLLLNEVYSPPALTYTYGIKSCYSLSANKIIDNLSKTGVLFGNSPEKVKVLERVSYCLHESYKQADNLTKILYWMSTAGGIIHYIFETVYDNKDNSGDASIFGARAFGNKIVQKSGFEAVYLFLCKVQLIAREAYENALNLLCKQIEPLLLNIFFGRGSTATLKGGRSAKGVTEPGSDIVVMQRILNNLVDLLLEHKISSPLAGDLVLQILKFVDETTFNLTVQQKRIFSSDGIRFKLACLQIEQWLKDSHAEIWFGNKQLTILKFVSDAANLITIEKEKLESVDFIRSTFKYLNLRQVLVITENFALDEGSKKPAPASVVKHLTHVLKASSDKHAPVQLTGALQWHMKNLNDKN